MSASHRPGLPQRLVIYCGDVGSVAKNHFGWARQDVGRTRSSLARGRDIRQLAGAIATDLNRGGSVALGFECPLFVPIADDPTRLTSARNGEGNRAWSAAAGAGSLVVGLTEVVWVLQEVRRLAQAGVEAFLDWQAFRASKGGLFVWEAFVTSQVKGKSHTKDAEIAVRRFAAHLPDIAGADAIRENAVHSLIGAALLRTEWSRDLALLKKACAVIKA